MSTAASPIRMGEIFRDAARLLGANFLLFAGIALIPGLGDLAYAVASHHHPTSGFGDSSLHSLLVFASYALSFILWIVSVVLGALGAGAICFAVRRLLAGEALTIGYAYGAAYDKAAQLVSVILLQFLNCFVTFLIFVFS